jgi:polyhydroxyalkanoate synthase subunit PhaE
MLEAWLKASAEFWASVVKVSFPASESAGSRLWWEKLGKGRTLEAWESSLKTMQALSGLVTAPESMQGVFKGVNTLPELMLKVVQPAWTSFFSLQQEWMKAAGRIGESTAAYSFENLDHDAFQAFINLYENEFRHFLTVPQLGLTRAYQERMNQALDRLNIFQATMAEFISLLYLPVEKSLKVMQEELAKLADQGNLPENSKDFYRMWIKVLEGHYMTLFKSAGYTHTLGKTLDAMSAFMVARKEILEDALQVLPVPTHKEMDELYREIYLLKKRVKELEKKDRNVQPQVETEG